MTNGAALFSLMQPDVQHGNGECCLLAPASDCAVVSASAQHLYCYLVQQQQLKLSLNSAGLCVFTNGNASIWQDGSMLVLPELEPG